MREGSVHSLTKAISILRCFNPRKMQWGVNEISRELKIPASTAHRLLSTLLDNGILEQDPVTHRYKIGYKLYAIGSLFVDSSELVVAAEPVMKILNDCTGEIMHLGILDNANLVTVLKEQGWSTAFLNTHMGMVVPAHSSTMGKALLSELSDEELNKLYPHEQLQQMTINTVATRVELKKRLAQIRKAGVSRGNQECIEGIEAVAWVLRNASGKAVAAMSISVPAFSMDKKKLQVYMALIKIGCDLVSYRLGYRFNGHVYSLEGIRAWWEQNKAGIGLSENNVKAGSARGNRDMLMLERKGAGPSHELPGVIGQVASRPH